MPADEPFLLFPNNRRFLDGLSPAIDFENLGVVTRAFMRIGFAFFLVGAFTDCVLGYIERRFPYLGLLLLIGCGLLGRAFVRRWWLAHRLARNGTQLEGHVISSSFDSDGCWLSLEYCFRNPAGKKITNSDMAPSRTDVDDKCKPQPGTRVVILYENDSTYQIL